MLESRTKKFLIWTNVQLLMSSCFHRKKADEFGILAIAPINGLFVFHLQVINKVDEQYSAN